MTGDLVKQSIAELQDLVRCRCHPVYKDLEMHDPDCDCDSAAAVQVVADRIEELEAREEAILWAALERAYHLYDDEGPDAYISVLKIKHDLTALADITPFVAAILKKAGERHD